MHRVSRSLTYHCDAFRNSDRRRPEECSRWQRDRVAVLRRVMQSLYIQCRPVEMVNGRPATQGEQAAENKDRSKDFPDITAPYRSLRCAAAFVRISVKSHG